MKVLVIGLNFSPEPTGIAPYTAALCRGLVARGHRVRVLTSMPHYPEWRIREGYSAWAEDEHVDGVLVHRMRHYVPALPSGVRRLLSELSFGIRSIVAHWGKPEVIVFVSPALFSTAVAMVKARLFSIPAIVWVQDLYTLGIVETTDKEGAGVVARMVRQVESAVLTRANGVCVIHARFASVAERLGAAPERLEVVRNWTHLPTVVPTVRAEARRWLGWGEEEVIALHSGAMGRKQDLGNVVAAARLADLHNLHVRFVLMGNGSERQRLEQSAVGSRSIEFMDPIPGHLYQAALAAADVLIVNEHAGLREMAVPSKLTSYFSSGRPIVAATDAESVTASELAGAGAGVRVAPGDPAALLEAVLELRADVARAEEMGRRGQAYREGLLSESAAIDRFATWLDRVVRDARRSPTGRRRSS